MEIHCLQMGETSFLPWWPTCDRNSLFCKWEKPLFSHVGSHVIENIDGVYKVIRNSHIIQLLMLSTLGKIFSSQHINIYFLLFPENRF